VETKELVELLGGIDGQLELHGKAKAGDSQSMVDFVRFCVLRKIYSNKGIPQEEKIKAFERLMEMVVLTAIKE